MNRPQNDGVVDQREAGYASHEEPHERPHECEALEDAAVLVEEFVAYVGEHEGKAGFREEMVVRVEGAGVVLQTDLGDAGVAVLGVAEADAAATRTHRL